MNKPLIVVFCLPGNMFSNNFLISWSHLFLWCLNNNIQPVISNNYSPVVYYVRNSCLGGDNLRGIKQKPFNGQVNYDYLMWIDSDIVFTVNDFKKLLEHDKDIVSGLYLMSDNQHFTAVEDMNETFFIDNGYYKFLSKDELKNKNGLFEVDYIGFGWILIKKGVFESLEYPWFRPEWSEFNINGNVIKDFSSEDVGICMNLRNKGYKIWVDPSIVVGHEKKFII